MTTPFPLIEVSGPAFERGKQYGKQAVDRIYKGIEHYTGQWEKGSRKRPGRETAVGDHLPVMERFDPQHGVEQRGTAEGADISYDDVVLLTSQTVCVN